MTTKRPNLSEFFKAQIDRHVHGSASTARVRLPIEVAKVHGSVTSPEIKVVMRDGSEFLWSGGQYSTRKVRGCYAPLMPKPVK